LYLVIEMVLLLGDQTLVTDEQSAGGAKQSFAELML
jgi:hypothetical protein